MMRSLASVVANDDIELELPVVLMGDHINVDESLVPATFYDTPTRRRIKDASKQSFLYLQNEEVVTLGELSLWGEGMYTQDRRAGCRDDVKVTEFNRQGSVAITRNGMKLVYRVSTGLKPNSFDNNPRVHYVRGIVLGREIFGTVEGQKVLAERLVPVPQQYQNDVARFVNQNFGKADRIRF